MISFSGVPRVRKQQTPARKFVPGVYWKLVGNTWIKFTSEPSINPSPTYQDLKVTTDEKHPGPPYASGGPFTSFSVRMSPSVAMAPGIADTMVPVFVSGQGNIRLQYRGGFASPSFSGFDFTDAQYANESFLFSQSGIVPPLDAYYPQVAKTLQPKLSQANLAQSLAELREIPLMLKQTSNFFKDIWRGSGGNMLTPFMSPKRVSDDYLNLQFGWTPFVKDVVDLTRAVMFASDYIRDLIRRNGSWEKRARVINEVLEDTTLGSGTGMRCIPSGLDSNNWCDFVPGMGARAWWSIRRRRQAKIWCSGEYKFYMPEFDPRLADFDSYIQDLRRHLTIYGARISPSVLWRITPWTWLVDWFANVGSLIEELENAGSDQIVSRNLYLMHRETKEIVLQQDINLKSGARSFEFIRLQETKQRDHASTPFGFGFSPTSLSVKQWSILAALGISKFL